MTVKEDTATTLPLTTIIEPSTGREIDLTGLSPEERLYCLIETYVNPLKYDGADGLDCLIGQPAVRLVDERPELLDVTGGRDSYDECKLMSKLTSVENEVIETIFRRAAWDEYCQDLNAAKAMARRVLGLEESVVMKNLGSEPNAGAKNHMP